MGGWRGSSDGDSSGGNDNDGRGMGVSSCRDIVVDIAASGFGPPVTMERI